MHVRSFERSQAAFRNGRSDLRREHRRLLRGLPSLRRRLRPALVPREDFVSFDYALGAALSVLLAAYLVYALVRPERF